MAILLQRKIEKPTELEENFFKACFNNNYQNLEALINIKTTEELSAKLSQYQTRDIKIFKEKSQFSY